MYESFEYFHARYYFIVQSYYFYLDDLERPRDLDSAPAEPPKPRSASERTTTAAPEKVKRKLVTYDDSV